MTGLSRRSFMGGVMVAPLAVSQVGKPGPHGFSWTGELTQGGWLRGTAPPGTRSLTLDGAAVPLAGDGAFFIAFDRDSGSAHTLVAALDNGTRSEAALVVAPRAWQIERINTAKRPGSAPTAEYERLRSAELARIRAARTAVTAAAGWRQRFAWPLRGRISGRFGAQRIYQGEPGSYHSGLDLATGGSGAPFAAPADGVVVLAAQAPFTLEGRLLMLDHGMGLSSAFLHCSGHDVAEGDTVRQGQVIGRIGATGRATGPHLHWGLKWRDTRLDPLLFVGAVPAG